VSTTPPAGSNSSPCGIPDLDQEAGVGRDGDSGRRRLFIDVKSSLDIPDEQLDRALDMLDEVLGLIIAEARQPRRWRRNSSPIKLDRCVSPPNEAWQEWQGSAFARVRSRSLA
jgi:hypothetical protein